MIKKIACHNPLFSCRAPATVFTKQNDQNKGTNSQRMEQVKIIKPHSKLSCLKGHKLLWKGGERVLQKDLKEAETHPSDFEDEVLLPRPLLSQNFGLCVSVCVCHMTAYCDTNELPVK